MLIVLNSTVPSRVLKKTHNVITYPSLRETIADQIIRFANIDSEENASDILTTKLRNEKFYYLVKKWSSKYSKLN
jgi:hypothetical protein